MIIMAFIVLYTAFFYVPKNPLRIFSDMGPTRVVIIDSITDTKKEIVPDPEHQRL